MSGGLNMPENKNDSELIPQLVAQLASKDPVARETSREQLVSIGGLEVTRALVGELTDPRAHVRWEAAKALADIADPVAAPGLMHALEDDDEDVRWVAGEAMIALGVVGLKTVLSGLTRRAGSLEFCKAAHHVLHELRPKGYAETVEPVLKTLEMSEPGVTAPPAAFNALVAMNDLVE